MTAVYLYLLAIRREQGDNTNQSDRLLSTQVSPEENEQVGQKFVEPNENEMPPALVGAGGGGNGRD